MEDLAFEDDKENDNNLDKLLIIGWKDTALKGKKVFYVNFPVLVSLYTIKCENSLYDNKKKKEISLC